MSVEYWPKTTATAAADVVEVEDTEDDRTTNLNKFDITNNNNNNSNHKGHNLKSVASHGDISDSNQFVKRPQIKISGNQIIRATTHPKDVKDCPVSRECGDI